MYALINRRKGNPERQEETGQQARREYFPKLEQAPGFVSLQVIRGEDGYNTAIALWESAEHAKAFAPESGAWAQTLEQHGHRLDSNSAGEVAQHVVARK